MKKIILVGTLLILLMGCKTSIAYVQIYETEAVNSKKGENCYTYENDTLRVDYVFWADKGIMAFRVLNKSAKPIYIDWFKSSYISNSLRYQYWTDKTKTEVDFAAVSVKNPILFPSVTGFTGSAIATRSKPERISFIPPKSYIEKAGYFLTDKYFTNWGKDFVKKDVPRNDRPKLITTIFSKQFTKENTPLDFRNFLTVSFKENFSEEFYIDNEYFIKSITAMDKNHFWDNTPDANHNSNGDYKNFVNDYFTITRFKKGTDFYIKTYTK